MFRQLVVGCALVFVAVSAFGQGADNAALQEEIRKLDLAHAEAILKGDVAALDVLMDDDVTVNRPTNKIVKETGRKN